MKKFLSLLLAVMMLLGCIPAMAEDAEWKINQYTGLVSRKSAAEKLDSIVVPAEVNGIAVRGIEYMAFNMYKNFKQLTIADSAVMLDRRVLRDLLKLEAVDLPENLLIIREGNFTNLPKLTSVVIPANVVLVHSSFNKCASLTSITFEGMCPVFVTEGTFGMFTELPADCVIYVPDNQVDAYKAALADREDVVARIQPSGAYAYRIDRTSPESDFVFDAATGTITGYTGNASYLKIPASIGGVQVRHIADEAFVQCHSLCCVIIPEGVETVGAWAFAGIALQSYVSLPSTLVSVGSEAFSSSSSYMCAISFGGDAVPAYDASAFSGFKGDWQLILPYGTSQEQVDAFAAYLNAAAPAGVVKASIIEPYKFPALDAEAGAPFIGNWNAVAVFDGVDYYGMDLLGISMIVNLQADGNGVVDMDGDATPGGWYVENGAVVFAPILEEGGQPVPEEAMPFTMDENGRMVLDLGGLYLLLELEGKTYAVPAIPEKPWPAFDLDNAKHFIGTWEAVSYIVEGETYSAELMGKMMLILNDDGTASSMEPGEEPYELYWYADYGTAYVGPAMSALAKVTFDGTGNIKMDQDGLTVILAPYVEKKVIEGADELLGVWYDDIGNKLTIVNDGTLTHTYAYDGWTDEYAWDVVDGAAVVTEGPWSGLPITLENGILTITNDEGIFQIFSVDGDLSAYYGEDDGFDMPEAMPVGPEGEPYFGAWKADMYGMEITLTLNADGTCAMEMMGESEPAVWSVVDGKANVMGDELYIDGDGNLVYEAQGMVFAKAEETSSGDEMTDEELMAFLALLGQMVGSEGGEEIPEELQPYVGTWHLVYMATGVLNGDLRQMGLTGKLVLNADGTGEMTGVADDSGNWYDDDGQVRFGKSDTALTLLEGGFLRYGTELAGYMVFSQNEAATWAPAPVATHVPAPTAAPAAPVVNGDGGYVGKTFVLTSAATVYAGQSFPVDVSAFGEYKVCFREDGKVTFVQGGIEMPADYLVWSINADGAYVLTYAMGDTVIMEYIFTPADGALNMDYYGTMMTFTPAE